MITRSISDVKKEPLRDMCYQRPWSTLFGSSFIQRVSLNYIIRIHRLRSLDYEVEAGLGLFSCLLSAEIGWQQPPIFGVSNV